MKEYPFLLLIVEGNLQEISHHKTPASVWGALISLMMNSDYHIISSSSKEQTAEILYVLEMRLEKERREPSFRFWPKMLSLLERQKFLVQGFPYIGNKISEDLLEHFGTA